MACGLGPPLAALPSGLLDRKAARLPVQACLPAALPRPAAAVASREGSRGPPLTLGAPQVLPAASALALVLPP